MGDGPASTLDRSEGILLGRWDAPLLDAIAQQVVHPPQGGGYILGGIGRTITRLAGRLRLVRRGCVGWLWLERRWLECG